MHPLQFPGGQYFILPAQCCIVHPTRCWAPRGTETPTVSSGSSPAQRWLGMGLKSGTQSGPASETKPETTGAAKGACGVLAALPTMTGPTMVLLVPHQEAGLWQKEDMTSSHFSSGRQEKPVVMASLYPAVWSTET